MKNYLRNWNFMRVLRLALGILIIAQGIQGGLWMLVALGILFSLMPLLNFGCCTTGNCIVPKKRNSAIRNNEIIFEELKSKQ